MTDTQNALSAGDTAPDFDLPATGLGEGETQKLSELLSNAVVLFFYPRDDTPGCTKEAIGFTGSIDDFNSIGVRLVGMSPDPLKKHLKFQDKHSLGVQLIADEERTALEAYGVWVEKSMYGKKYMGVERSTFLIGKDGKILKIWRKVKVPGHVEDVLESAKELLNV